MAHLQASKDIPQKQRDRINKKKCDTYIPACAAFATPREGETDYVKAWGWDRETDKGTITKFQSQYRNAAQACYRLGYVRAMDSFRPFLKNAKYWYKRLANHLGESFQALLKTTMLTTSFQCPRRMSWS